MTDQAPALAPSQEERPSLPSGGWRVVPAMSSVAFTARGVWGAVPVSGTLSGLSGRATVHGDGRIDGELTIPTGWLDSGNRLRDRHLKSASSLHVERYPNITFAPRRIWFREGGYVLEGTLRVRDRDVELVLPVEVRNGRLDGMACRFEWRACPGVL